MDSHDRSRTAKNISQHPWLTSGIPIDTTNSAAGTEASDSKGDTCRSRQRMCTSVTICLLLSTVYMKCRASFFNWQK